MSNSPLVDYTHLSPNHSGQRTHAIDRITPHCVVGQLSVETMGAMFAQPSFDASCNYDIGSDGRVGLVVPENQRSWCSSSRENDQRAVTIECASDKVSPYAINDKVYNKLIDLMVDVCRRNGKSKLLWFGNKEKTLAYEPQPEEMLMTVHRWFANKACPGDYIYNRLPQIASTVTLRLSGVSPVKQMLYRVRLAWDMPQTQTGAYYVLDNAKKECPAGYSVYDESGTAVWTNNANGTQARSLNGLSEAEKIRKVAPLYQDVARKTGLLASAGLAQFALESGYGTTDLAQNANNLHGMKCSLSGNTWPNSAWDGVSKYEKKTAEQDKYGNEYYVWADFRKYPRIEDSIADRAAYYLGAMNGSQRRYPGIENLTTAEAQIKAIKAGGYATDVNYVTKLMNIVNRFNLTQYDVPKDNPAPAPTPTPPHVPTTTYRVQVGFYERKGNATRRMNTVKEKTGYDCFTEHTEAYRVYCGSFSVSENAEQRAAILKEEGIDCFVVEVIA